MHLVHMGEVSEIVFVDAHFLDSDAQIIGTQADSDLVESFVILV